MSKTPYDLISPGRLTSFSDGVFAIAVTLLVFNLKVPKIPDADVHQLLPGALLDMLSQFVTYLISFLLIAVFWTIHHRMLSLIVHVDHTFIWFNLIYLLVISFIPFPSALMGTYPSEPLSMVIYICCMFMAVGISLLMWRYATRGHRLISKDISRSTINYFYIRGTATIGIFTVALPLAIYKAHWGQVCLLIIFPIQWLLKSYHKKQSRVADSQ